MQHTYCNSHWYFLIIYILLWRQIRWLGHFMKLSSNRLSASLLVHDATRATGGHKKQCKNQMKISFAKHNISQSNSENIPDDRDKWRTGCNAGIGILTVNALKGRMLVTPADTKVDLGLLINLTSALLAINRVCAWALVLRSHARLLYIETPQSWLMALCIT